MDVNTTMSAPESTRGQATGVARTFRWRGDYLSEEALEILPFDEAPLNRVAFLFPGQGDFPPGRAGDWTERLPELRAHVATADAFCRQHELGLVSDYLVNHSGNHEPIVAMLSLLTFSCGISARLKARGIRAAACAGFSFGELSALVASELVSFETALELAWVRDRCCPPPFSAGGMIFVGAPPTDMTALIEGSDEIVISNFCSPQKTVVSVRSDVRGWVRRLRRARLPALALKAVPQPYHTDWLADATKRTRNELESRSFSVGQAACHFVSSHHDWNQLGQSPDPRWLADAVADPLCQPVDFPRQVRRLAELGIDSCIEVGLGGGLGDFIRDIEPVDPPRFWQWERHVGWDRPTTGSSTPRYELALKDHPLLDRLTRALTRITGYELESVSLEQRFQEDFGIDSIKKAEILFSVAEEAGLKPSAAYASNEIANLGDAMHYLTTGPQGTSGPVDALQARSLKIRSWALDWQESTFQPSESEPVPRSWLEIDLGGFCAAHDPTGLPAVSDEGSVEGLLLYSGPDSAASLEPEHVDRFIRNWLPWHQSLWKRPEWRDKPVVLIRATQSASYVHGLAAFFRSLAKESPGLNFRDVRCDDWPLTRDRIRRMADTELDRESEGPVRVAASGRRILRPVQPADPAPPSSDEASGGWLILGATAATCRTLLPAMAEQGQLKEAYLVGRRDPQDEDLGKLMTDLKEKGVRLHYHCADVTQPGSTTERLREAGKWFAASGFGVIHAVGIEASVPWEGMDPDIANQIVTSKLQPAFEIVSQPDPEHDRVVFFSSLASLCGNAGQAAYAFANATLNALADSRPNCLSIAWPAWDGVGMASQPAVMARLRDGLLPLLPAKNAGELMGGDLAEFASGLRYYSDVRDLWMLRDPARLGPSEEVLLGGLHEGFYLRRTFRADSDAWLRDHTVRGMALVPGAFMMEAALTYARRTFGGEAYLERFDILSPLAVPAERGGSWRLRQFFAQEDQLSIHAAGDRVETWQALARPLAETKDQESRLTLSKAKQRVEPIYGKEGLFHGPAFQVLEEAIIDDRFHGTGRIRGEALPVTGEPLADAGIRTFEAGFQLAGLAAFLKFGRICLPVGAEGICLSEPEAVSILEMDDFTLEEGEARARIRFLTAEGRLLGAMDRVRMQETAQDA